MNCRLPMSIVICPTLQCGKEYHALTGKSVTNFTVSARCFCSCRTGPRKRRQLLGEKQPRPWLDRAAVRDLSGHWPFRIFALQNND